MEDYTKPDIDVMFRSKLPSNFYYNHYELSQIYPNYTPEDWRQYLKLNERFIMNEISAITEASARSALQRLGDGALSSSDIAAIKQLLERSEQINSGSKDARTFVMMQFDTKDHLQLTTAGQKQAQVMLDNQQNVHNFYNLSEYDSLMHFYYRERCKCIIRNADGTLHFPDTSHKEFTRADLVYLRCFNPKNVLSYELPKFEDDSDLEEIQ